MDVIQAGSSSTLLTITNQGYGKRSSWRVSSTEKGCKGVKNIDARKGFVCCTTTVSEEDELLVQPRTAL